MPLGKTPRSVKTAISPRTNATMISMSEKPRERAVIRFLSKSFLSVTTTPERPVSLAYIEERLIYLFDYGHYINRDRSGEVIGRTALHSSTFGDLRHHSVGACDPTRWSGQPDA